MKTKNFIPTLLALIIRVMVTGQTQEIQSQYRILNALGGKAPSSPSLGVAKKQALKEKSDAIQNDRSKSVASKPKVYPTLISAETPSANNTDNNTFNYYNNPSCYTSRLYVTELLKQADELLSIAGSLKQQASEKNQDEKEPLLTAALSLEKQAELKQVQASEISGKLSLDLFNKNETIYSALMDKVKKEIIQDWAITLHDEAAYSIKIAKEMREEAYSITSTAAKLGVMSNAEEKESHALAKQDEAITVLKNAIAAHQIYQAGDLAVK
jgi:hypothetical protein